MIAINKNNIQIYQSCRQTDRQTRLTIMFLLLDRKTCDIHSVLEIRAIINKLLFLTPRRRYIEVCAVIKACETCECNNGKTINEITC